MNLLEAVIGLPANLFFGTGIPACVLVFKKNRSRKDILFIDASNDGHYEKGKNQNNLREEDIKRIVDAYEKYGDIDKFAHVATLDEIRENECNLNIPRYVDTFEEEEPVDMDAVKQNIANIKIELAEVETKMEKQFEELGL
jgi:type I restriction enzyme M protein